MSTPTPTAAQARQLAEQLRLKLTEWVPALAEIEPEDVDELILEALTAASAAQEAELRDAEARAHRARQDALIHLSKLAEVAERERVAGETAAAVDLELAKACNSPSAFIAAIGTRLTAQGAEIARLTRELGEARQQLDGMYSLGRHDAQMSRDVKDY